MSKRWVIGFTLAMVTLCVLSATNVSAATLKISPLRYDTTLSAGEKKKGFVDITNPASSAVHVLLTVQAFRQTDNTGSLEFYNDEKVRQGVLLDYTETTLGPRETLHLAFVLDGSKLAQGDNFAAVFATTVPAEAGAGEQVVRVGSLLVISNGTPSIHAAEIQNMSSQFIQFGDGIQFSFDVHNTAEQGASTGFAPSITITAWPYVNETVTGPLVFAGRTRAVTYVKAGNYIGLINIKAKTGNSEQNTYAFVMSGYWRFLVPFALAVIGLLLWLLYFMKSTANNRGK